jgi:hypothetical protein
VVLSLAEMESMAPTSGGQYHWVSEFAPANCQKILSYASGELSSSAKRATTNVIEAGCQPWHGLPVRRQDHS